jgi:hypothetical protein
MSLINTVVYRRCFLDLLNVLINVRLHLDSHSLPIIANLDELRGIKDLCRDHLIILLLKNRCMILILWYLRFVVKSSIHVSTVHLVIPCFIIRDDIVVHIGIVDEVDRLLQGLFATVEDLEISLLVQS